MPRILIVDDDPVIRKTMKKVLGSLPAEVVCCSDGIHGLDILRCNPDFDLLITDIQMPTLDGRMLTSAVLADRKLRDIPIIIMSGVVGVREVSDLLEQGATKFITKPIKANIMRDDVMSCLVKRTKLTS